MTEKCLEIVVFSVGEVRNIIRGLGTNKAYGPDKISIRMLKICGNATGKPLEIIYKEYLNLGLFPLQWKKEHIAPVNKNGDKQNLRATDQCHYFPFVENSGATYF